MTKIDPSLSQRVKRLAVASALCGSFVVASVATNTLPVHAAGGGPIVLDGMDPVIHSRCDSSGTGTGIYIANVLKDVYGKSTYAGNDGKIYLFAQDPFSDSCSTEYLSGISGTKPTFEYVGASDLETFFTNLAAGTVKPRVIWMSDWMDNSAVGSTLTAHASDIADFVNNGGGLFANRQGWSDDGYGWLSALFPSAKYISSGAGCNGGPHATADGAADFGLTDSLVEACWHGYFVGSFAPLKVLADQPVDPGADLTTGSDDGDIDCSDQTTAECLAGTRVAVSIGGGSVTLPSALSGTASNAKPDAGGKVTVTVSTIAPDGTKYSGVVVTITVTSGPNKGFTTTVTTDANGLATFDLSSKVGGTDVISLSATVNGKAKTSTVTVEWQGVEPQKGPDGKLPELKPGQSQVLLDGNPVTVTTKVVQGSNLVMSATDGFKLTLGGECSTECTIKTGADGKPYMELESGGKAKVSGEGFEPGTYANVFLFSTPVFLGKVLVGSDGKFTDSLPVPASVAAGEHTLQVWGTSAGGGVRTANLGVVVLGQPSVGINATPWLVTMLLFMGLGLVVFTFGKRREQN